jgi:hypothetical protein
MSTTTTIPNVTTVSTDILIHELLVQQRAMTRAEDRADAIKAQLVERLGEGGKYESHEAKVAIVVSETSVIDIDALESAASKGIFYKLSKRVVDMTAYKALHALGQVPDDVENIVTKRISKPAVRLTLIKR